MLPNKNEIEILRTLAKQYAEVAALPKQAENRQNWINHNALRPTRPMVSIDQLPWHELNTDGSLTLQCTTEPWMGYERMMRQTLYKWNHIPADMVVDAYIPIQKVVGGNAGFGIGVEQDVASLDPQNSVVGHLYHDQLKTEEDLEKLLTPKIFYDKEATQKNLDEAKEVFGDIIEVRLKGVVPNNSSWDLISQWRGVEAPLYDMADRPEFIHALMDRLTNAYMGLLDQFEEQGLLETNAQLIHCTGAYSDEIPKPGYNPEKTRTIDCWTYGLAQMLATVSPDMVDEFEIEYTNKWFARFGLVYYGCCEPLDRKMHIIRKIKNLRKVSMSPWTDANRGAEGIGKDYVFSSKPNPAFLANTWDPSVVEKSLREIRDACRRNGCPLELVQKDVSTIGYDPSRLWEWEKIAMRIVNE